MFKNIRGNPNHLALPRKESNPHSPNKNTRESKRIGVMRSQSVSQWAKIQLERSGGLPGLLPRMRRPERAAHARRARNTTFFRHSAIDSEVFPFW